MQRWTRMIAVCGLVVGLAPASASGQHLGWCIGVGNKHNTGCAPTTGVTTGGGTPSPPTANPMQPTPGPGLPETPPRIVVPPTPVPTPQATPQLVPMLVPPATPHAVPPMVPRLVGAPTAPVTIVRPLPMAGAQVRGVDPQTQAVSLVETTTRQPWTVGLVTATPGRQPRHATPSYRTPDGFLVQCLAGGFGWRYVAAEDGSVRLVGRLPVLRTTDVIVRDLPANHLMTPDCVVAVRRRLDN